MKKIGFLLFVTVLSINACIQVQAQELRLPQASPKSQVSQTVGLTDFTVNYHAPSVKNREIWGKIVNYQEIWRTGANEATTISFNQEIKFNGERVPAGKYSFFLIPTLENTWMAILNKDTTLWGTEGYDSEKDIVRTPVVPVKDNFQESLLFTFNNVYRDGCQFNLNWEKLRISIPIEVFTDQQVLANIRKATEQAKPDNWLLFAQSANYLVQNDIQHEFALKLINRSIEIKENFYNLWVKARLLAQKNEFEEAAKITNKAMKLGNEEPKTYKSYAADMERYYKLWSTYRR